MIPDLWTSLENLGPAGETMLCRAPASRVHEQRRAPTQPPGFFQRRVVQALLYPGNGRERHDERKSHQHHSGRNNAIRGETSGCPYPCSSRRANRGDAAAPCHAERRRQCRAHRGDRDSRRAFRRPPGTTGAGRAIAGFPAHHADAADGQFQHGRSDRVGDRARHRRRPPFRCFGAGRSWHHHRRGDGRHLQRRSAVGRTGDLPADGRQRRNARGRA